ncbi:hypothetical protein [Streptomyces sp. NPDC056105]|uniref:hypothetical protein n=1 Tax=Streptomyces sp. NPDC056105 TaxID=3345714 RepID=UPI0035DF2F77
MTARDDIAAHFTSDALADELLDAYRSEILREEMRNLRRIEREDTPEGALGTRTGLLRAALILDERAELIGEKATAAAATATPTPFLEDARLRTLHDAMRAQPGEWRTSHARRALRDAGFKGLGRNTASQFLRALVEKGLATAHGPEDGRFYTLSTTGKDGRA